MGRWEDGGTYENGEKFIGDWNNDKIGKNGKYFYANGDIYTGEWESDKAEGQGELQVKKMNSVFEGLFSQGKIQEGIETTKDGTKFEGKWDDNLLKYGCFKITEKDGAVRNTYYKEDIENLNKYNECKLIEELAPDVCSICHDKIRENKRAN